MNSRNTLWLLLAAASLLFYIFFFEGGPAMPGPSVNVAQKLIPDFDPAKVVSIEILRSNNLIRIERTNDQWRLAQPAYPAQETAVQNWLSVLASLNRRAWISAEDLLVQPGGLAAFGLENPHTTITLQHAGKRLQMRLGDKTQVGEKLYVQQVGSEGVLVTESALVDRLPRSAAEWRDPAFLSLAGLNFDRLLVRSGSREFEFERGPTNRWRLIRPRPARADNTRIGQLLQQLLSARVGQFVTDVPGGDLEPYGLHLPEAVVTFSQGTNQLLAVEFGKSLTNHPALVHARRSTYPSVVAVPKQILDLLRAPYTEFLDHHLVEVSPSAVERVEVRGAEQFVVQKQTNGSWRVTEPASLPADPALVQAFFQQLNSLQWIDLAKEVVTDLDLPTYGLAPPARQFVLKSAATTPGATNQLLAQIDFGTNQNGRIFVRRSDENSVYTTSLDESLSLPGAAFELRDRRIWNFTPNDVASVTITLQNRSHKLLRSEGGKWKIAEGSEGMVNPLALEEAVYRLGRLRARVWVAQGEKTLASYGFKEVAHSLVVELKNGGKPEALALEFGSASPSGGPFAAVQLEGGRTVFEFPVDILLPYSEAVRNLSMTAGVSR